MKCCVYYFTLLFGPVEFKESNGKVFYGSVIRDRSMNPTRYRWWLTLRIWVLIIFTIATALQSADILHGWVSHNRWLLWFSGYVYTCLPPTIFQCTRYYLWEILLTILILFFFILYRIKLFRLCIVTKQRMFFKVVYNCITAFSNINIHSNSSWN